MTTLLAMATSICEETGFFPVPTAIVSNSDETVTRLRRALNRGVEMTARRHRWPILQREHTFTTDGTDTYDLPDDFHYLIEQSAWNRTDYWAMRGSLSARDWQIRKSALGQQVGLRDRFRINAGDNAKTIRIDPTPASGEDLVLEYVSRNPIETFTKSQFTADADEPDIDSWLVELAGLWLFQRSVGKPYADERADWEMECDQAFMRDAPPPAVSLSRDPVAGQGKPVANIPDTGFGV